MDPQSKLPNHTAGKWATDQTVTSNSISVSVDHRQIDADIGCAFSVYEPTFALRHMPSLPAMVEEVTRPPKSHTSSPICELPLMVLEPNRRRVEPEEEFEELASPLSATSQRLTSTFRSLSLKHKS